MAYRSIDSTSFSDNRTIDASGVDVVELPTACSAITLVFRPNIGDDFSYIFNEDDLGDGIHNPLEVPAGGVINVDNFRIRTITIRSTAGSRWGYMAYMAPGVGLGYREAT